MQNKKDNLKGGYILIFTLIIVATLLLVSMSISRIIAKEVFFSKLIDYNKAAYFAADSGVECAQYLDSIFQDRSLGISLILNSTSSGDGEYDFRDNAVKNIFFATSTVPSFTNILASDYKEKIFCASDGTYNKIFDDTAYVDTKEEVYTNLNQRKSTFNIVGDSLHATTTFGIVLQEVDPNTANIVYRCVVVEFAKTKSEFSTNTSESFGIISTGFSSCREFDTAKVGRSIYRYSRE
ncbi:MAG: hypothetical protein RI945_300 [Candidatus Parcubacteria bacterium]|jgi:hypothetical protein